MERDVIWSEKVGLRCSSKIKPRQDFHQSGRCQVKSCVLWQIVFGSDKQEFSLTLRRVKSKKISSYTGKDLLKNVLKVRNASVEGEWVENQEELSICMKVIIKGKGRDESTNIGSVHDEK